MKPASSVPLRGGSGSRSTPLRGCRQCRSGSPLAVPIHASRRPARLTDGRPVRLVVVLAPTALQLGEPARELALPRSRLVAGPAPDPLHVLDAMCSGRTRLVPGLGGGFLPLSGFGRLRTRLDPEQLVE